MVNPLNSVLSINDARTYMEDVQSDIIKTSGVRAPFLMKHMRTVSKMGSKVQWFQQAISRGVLTLAGTYSAGATPRQQYKLPPLTLSLKGNAV